MSRGFLLVLMQPPRALEDEFNAWYDTEHLAERLAIPGIETALRFVCLSGHPKYLAMYDLESPQVITSPEYLRVAHGNGSPWTMRITSRVQIYRSTGRQIHPGDRLTGRCARVELVRLSGVPAAAEEEVVAGLRGIYEARPETGQLRVLAYENQGAVDYLGFAELRSPASRGFDTSHLGVHASHIDLVNTYAPYQF